MHESSSVAGVEYQVAVCRRADGSAMEILVGAGRYTGATRLPTKSGMEIFFPYLRFVPLAKLEYLLGEPPYNSARLEGLCDVVLLFSDTKCSESCEEELQAKGIDGWEAFRCQWPEGDPRLVPFDEYDVGWQLTQELRRLLGPEQPTKIVAAVLNVVASDHPALLIHPVVRAAALEVFGHPVGMGPFEIARATLLASGFLRAAGATLPGGQGRSVKFDMNMAVARIAAIGAALEALRNKGHKPTDQRSWRKPSKLRIRVYAALAGIAEEEAKCQIDSAIRYRQKPLGTRGKSLGLTWCPPYSVPFQEDQFHCPTNFFEIEWGLARWLRSPRLGEILWLLSARPGEAARRTDSARYFGGRTDGAEITDDIARMMGWKDQNGHPLSACEVALFVELFVLKVRRGLLEADTETGAHFAGETIVSDLVPAVVPEDAFRHLEAMSDEAMSVVRSLLAEHELTDGRLLTGGREA